MEEKHIRNREIYSGYKMGIPQSELARIYDISPNRVRSIIQMYKSKELYPSNVTNYFEARYFGENKAAMTGAVNAVCRHAKRTSNIDISNSVPEFFKYLNTLNAEELIAIKGIGVKKLAFLLNARNDYNIVGKGWMT